MKAASFILVLFFVISLTAPATFAQQQFTQTVTTQNKNCNATCSVIDVADLNNNPAAVIFVTPIGNASNLNPHPIGAYYMYLNKWSVFNLDGTAITAGAQFNVEYYVNPDSNHFVYVVPQRLHTGDVSYIDHVGLNNSPNAQIRVFPHVSSTIGNLWNRYEVKIAYDTAASKWFIADVNNTPVPVDSAYNLIFSSGSVVANSNVNKTINTTLQTSISTSQNSIAGGDLSGSYPNPTVVGLRGKPLSTDLPTVGQVLIWNGSAWAPGSEALPATTTPPPAAPFQTFVKTPPATTKTIAELQLSDNRPLISLSELSHSIVLNKKSRLMISGTISFSGPWCVVGCIDAEGMLVLRINNNGMNSTQTYFRVGNNRSGAANISNYVIDLDPGTYDVEFIVYHTGGTSPFAPVGEYSSIMVIPL